MPRASKYHELELPALGPSAAPRHGPRHGSAKRCSCASVPTPTRAQCALLCLVSSRLLLDHDNATPLDAPLLEYSALGLAVLHHPTPPPTAAPHTPPCCQLFGTFAAFSLLLASGDLVPAMNSIGDALLELPLGAMVLILILVSSLFLTLGAPNGLFATPAAILIAQKKGDDFTAAVFIAATTSFVALCASAVVSFWLGRTVFKSWALEAQRKSKIFQALGVAVQRNGVMVSALLRMCVVAALVDYNMAALGCSKRAFALGLVGHGELRLRSRSRSGSGSRSRLRSHCARVCPRRGVAIPTTPL